MHDLPIRLTNPLDGASPTTMQRLPVKHNLTLFGQTAEPDRIVIARLDLVGKFFIGQA